VYQGKRKVRIRHSIFAPYDILTFKLHESLTIALEPVKIENENRKVLAIKSVTTS